MYRDKQKTSRGKKRGGSLSLQIPGRGRARAQQVQRQQPESSEEEQVEILNQSEGLDGGKEKGDSVSSNTDKSCMVTNE